MYVSRYAVMASSCHSLCMWVPSSASGAAEDRFPEAGFAPPVSGFGGPPPRPGSSYTTGGGGTYQPGLY